MDSILKSLYFYPPPLLGLILSKISESLLKRAKVVKLEDAIKLAYSFRFIPFISTLGIFKGLSILPSQVPSEIMRLLKLLAKHKPRSVLEIGTARGGTLFLFTYLARSDATIVSMDLPGGPFRGGYPAWKIPLHKSFARYSTQRIYGYY